MFVIDPTPYEIRLSHTTALVESAQARLDLANRSWRVPNKLKESGAGTNENVEQRAEEQLSAQAALDDAQAQVRDAQFDLDHCRINGAVHRAHRGAPGVGWQPGGRQPSGQQSNDPIGHARFS
ncbi:MAG: hypothetical protein WDO13_19005 [Verrucomicrobiota bacterium]